MGVLLVRGGAVQVASPVTHRLSRLLLLDQPADELWQVGQSLPHIRQLARPSDNLFKAAAVSIFPAKRSSQPTNLSN